MPCAQPTSQMRRAQPTSQCHVLNLLVNVRNLLAVLNLLVDFCSLRSAPPLQALQPLLCGLALLLLDSYPSS